MLLLCGWGPADCGRGKLTVRTWYFTAGSDSRKATSYVRARNSGVNRLLRSSTSSLSSSNGALSGRSNADSHGFPDSNAHSNTGSVLNEDGPSSPAAADDPVDDEGAKSCADASADPSAAADGPPVSGSSTKNEDGDAVDVLSHSEDASEDADDALAFLDHKWTHLVLKMTAFTEDDPVTSFRFDARGGGVGRDAANVASIPADKLLADKDHARVLYSRGRFYLLANPACASGTFVRLSPCGSLASSEDGEPSAEDLEDRMQWPLAPTTSFRAGKSDFVVTKVDEATQTLELEARSGKLEGHTFVITRDGAGIGRSADNTIHAGDGELSRKHAAIWFDELTLQFYLVDLNSTNGTFMRLAGPYAEPYRLEVGDDLLVAQTCLSVNRFDFGAHASMGARKHMEDAHTVVQDLCVESLSRLGLHPQSYFAVYDGHGGDEASSFLGDELHHAIVDALFMKKHELQLLLGASPAEVCAMVQQRLISAFEKTDELFLQSSARPQAGSTATTVLVAGDVLFVANTGDSRTVLSRRGRAERLSNDHKPSRPDEAQRVRDTGGFVIHGRIMGELAVSRAFGDAPFKTFELAAPPSNGPGADKSSNASGGSNGVDSKPRSEYDSQELPVNPNDILKGPLVIATPEVTVTERTGTSSSVSAVVGSMIG